MKTICDLECPACNAVCWVDLGNIADFPTFEIQWTRCWECGEVFGTEDESTAEDAPYCEDTYPTPNKAARMDED